MTDSLVVYYHVGGVGGAQRYGQLTLDRAMSAPTTAAAATAPAPSVSASYKALAARLAEWTPSLLGGAGADAAWLDALTLTVSRAPPSAASHNVPIAMLQPKRDVFAVLRDGDTVHASYTAAALPPQAPASFKTSTASDGVTCTCCTVTTLA